MKVVIVYDISTVDAKGRNRLDRVRCVCMKWGIPVQKSVYECNIDNTQLSELAKTLNDIIRQDIDAVRFYILGNNYNNRILSFGRQNMTAQMLGFVL
mgnify:FL=1